MPFNYIADFPFSDILREGETYLKSKTIINMENKI
jgi:hypothetical protein